MDDELRVLSGPRGPAGPATAADLPLPAQALAVMAAGEEAGQEGMLDELVHNGLGALVFFASALADPAAAARRTGSLQAAALRSPVGAPLLLAADQEGGRVARLPGGPATMPGAMALGATGDAELARLAGRATSGQLRAVGLNWDLAPVCDLWTQDNPALGSRCFAADPAVVGAFAAAFVTGLQDGGVLACAKHFPGHGDTAVDSHRGLPVLHADLAALRARDWVPFEAGARAGVATLMMGHLVVPALEDPLPASLSPAFYRVAREALAFDGLLVTDALGMAGCAQAAGSVGEAAVLALLAGADIIMIAHGPDEHRAAQRAVVDAVEAGRLPRQRLAEAATAVLACKRRWNLARHGAPDDQGAAHLLNRPSDVRLAADIARRSITELRPGPAVPSPAVLGYGQLTPQVLVEAAAARWPGARLRRDGVGPWLSLDAGSHLLIGPPIPESPPTGRVLLAYDCTPASLTALLTCAAGETPATGRLPGPARPLA